MPKRSLAPDVLTEALALREAGFTVLAISQRLIVSVRTLQRHFAAHGVKKGAVKEELLAKARADLLSHITSDEAIRVEVGSSFTTTSHTPDTCARSWLPRPST
jgi:hypothetical protein